MQAAITKLKNDKNDAAAMLIEVLRYAEVGVKEENGPGYRALNQILDILIEMGYEERLIKEGKGRIQYMAHPKYGDWEGGKFKKEVVFGKENGPTY
jgi:hypothetical protein